MKIEAPAASLDLVIGVDLHVALRDFHLSCKEPEFGIGALWYSVQISHIRSHLNLA